MTKAYKMPSGPDDFGQYDFDSATDVLRFMIDVRQYVTSHDPPEGFIQQIHSDAEPVGNPERMAVNDASYPLRTSLLASISYPEFVPHSDPPHRHPETYENMPGFRTLNVLNGFLAFLETYGVELDSVPKMGHDAVRFNIYYETNVKTEEDYARARSLIDIYTRSRKTDPRALHAEIAKGFQKQGLSVDGLPDIPKPPGLASHFSSVVRQLANPLGLCFSKTGRKDTMKPSGDPQADEHQEHLEL